MSEPRALTEFIAEASEILDVYAQELHALESSEGREPDPERLNAIFRAAHSLKGLSSMFGLEVVASLAHHSEDLLDALRLGKVPLTGALLDALGQSVEVFQQLLATVSAGATLDALRPDAERLGADLQRLSQGGVRSDEDLLDTVEIDPDTRAVFTEYEEHRLRENVKKGLGLWKIRAAFSLTDFDTRLAELNVRLKPLGEVVSTLPSSQPGDEQSIAFDLVFATVKSSDELEAVLPPGVTCTALGKRRSKPAPSAPTRLPVTMLPPPLPRTSSVEPSLRSLTNTVRVDIGRLDALMNSIGELLLIRGNLERLSESARQSTGTALPKLWGQELQREARALERRLDELQKGVLEVRMVPLGQVFDKLARLMRRLVRESGKDVTFESSGGDVELDKLIVEELSDPLMHLLRNALDHGVELPAHRESVGKRSRATLSLLARQQGNHVIIEVRDDGAGFDERRIREVALERGMMSFDQLQKLERRELLNLVFQPGFSTRRDVSEMSGRGVGLDVVKTNLQHLSGLIDIDSRRGLGTTFTLTLPLTLAIIRALMVKVSGRTYAIPLNAVIEIVSVKDEQLRTIERREVFEVRGQTMPFVRLARIFRLPEVTRVAHSVVVVGLAQQRIGLSVDELLGQQDIVTKPLSGRLSGIPGVSGATELGDRRAVLVLDVGAILEELLRPTAREPRTTG